MLHQRLQEILEIVKQTGLVSVDELVAQFEVTPQTIRKDLNTLCDQHLLTRTHGGARLAFGIENMSYEARRVLAADKKQSIGKAVADIVGDNSSLFINIGTTTEAVALALANHNDLMVVTCTLHLHLVIHFTAAFLKNVGLLVKNNQSTCVITIMILIIII